MHSWMTYKSVGLIGLLATRTKRLLPGFFCFVRATRDTAMTSTNRRTPITHKERINHECSTQN
jgi:hypothetical protein